MFLDSLTYLTNLVSEKKKPTATPATMLKVRSSAAGRCGVKEVAKGWRQPAFHPPLANLFPPSQLELFPPLVSVVALVSVSGYIIATASITLTDKHPHAGDEEGDEATNTTYMLIFASINLALDILNVACFARASRLFGYDVSGDGESGGGEGGKGRTNMNMCSAYTHVLADTLR